uniref:Hemerythrin n=1 Tax=Phascolosoma esculenta TaxID=419950 RepID=B6CPA3_9ANNE|nr:hemerythrin [Phascolosoma esculenta]
MGFPVPDPYVWDESFKVFYDDLDNQHKQLFQGLFSMGANPGSQAALDNAYAVLNSHFLFEEAAMQVAKYAGYPPHKKAHDDFLAEVHGKSVPLDAGFVNYTKDWLVQHIKTIDFKYKGKL